MMNTVIKILYISWTENMSGGEISFINYINELKRQKKEYFLPLFLCPKKGNFSERLLEEKIPVQLIPVCSFSFTKPWHFFIALVKIVRLIKKEKISLIHNTSFYSNQIAVVAGIICNVPVVTHGQSFVTEYEIKRNLLPYASKIIACSNAVKQNLLPYVKEERIKVLWHAIPLPKVKKKIFWLHKDLSISRECTLIGHIGLLEERKRQEDLIRAAQRILQKNKKARFLIIGSAQFGTKEYEEYLHQLAKRLHVEQAIFFLGFRKDVQDILPELDIVTLPSLHEPFALVMIEAMALGIPFIGADSGGTPEMIQHKKNGLLIPPKDHAALAEAIILLLDNKDVARKIGNRGRVSVAKECNVEKLVSILFDLYINLI